MFWKPKGKRKPSYLYYYFERIVGGAIINVNKETADGADAEKKVEIKVGKEAEGEKGMDEAVNGADETLQ